MNEYTLQESIQTLMDYIEDNPPTQIVLPKITKESQVEVFNLLNGASWWTMALVPAGMHSLDEYRNA
jgi:hypothetical protein